MVVPARAQQLLLVPKAGASLHTFESNTVFYETAGGTGLAGGLALEWGLLKNNRLAIQPEILFVQKGGKADFPDFAPMLTNDEVYRINYLEIPVLLKASAGGERLRVFVNAGPAAALALGGRLTYLDSRDFRGYEARIRFGSPDSENSPNVYLSPRLDLSLQAGGGLSYRLAGMRLLLEARYGHGLRSLNRAERPREDYDKSNRALLLLAGVAFPLNKN